MTLEQMDEELRAVRAHLRWLCDDAIAEMTEELETETNPYTREFMLSAMADIRKIGERAAA
jgi:hypothetical protein